MWKKIFRKYRVYVILISLLVIFISIIYLSASNENSSGEKSSLVSEIIYPWQKLTAKISRNASYAWQSLAFFIHLKSDNEKLNKELSILKAQNNELMEVSKENERIKKLLDYKKKVSYKLKLAKVIGRDVNNYFSIIYLDMGRRDGISNDMVVISDNGIVGKVVSVLPEVSSVMQITDYKSNLSGIVQRTRCVGSISGLGKNLCKMKYLSIKDDVKKGDMVITSGDGRYPKGLIVGEVTDVLAAPDGMSLNVYLKPVVDFLKLEETFIITDM